MDSDEAVAIALWRSPALQAALTNLDAALADFDEARRPLNPRLWLLAPMDPRQLAIILAWPIEAIWQVPPRAEAALCELERVAESLVQLVLDIERDVRLAHADARLSGERRQVLEAIASSWREAAGLAEARVRAGDIAAAEAASVRAEATIAADAVSRARREEEIAKVRLMELLGAPETEQAVLAQPPSRPAAIASLGSLVALALRQRPDLRAAELAMHSAAARARWERARVFSLVASLDGQAPRGELSPNFTVGAQLELPVFNQNQGGIGRADAAVARAGYLYAATRLTVTREVVTAYAATQRAKTSLEAYESVLLALGDASRGARHAFEDGAESYLVVIDALRREAHGQLRRIELDADLARAEAELFRAVGGSPGIEAR